MLIGGGSFPQHTALREDSELGTVTLILEGDCILMFTGLLLLVEGLKVIAALSFDRVVAARGDGTPAESSRTEGPSEQDMKGNSSSLRLLLKTCMYACSRVLAMMHPANQLAQPCVTFAARGRYYLLFSLDNCFSIVLLYKSPSRRARIILCCFHCSRMVIPCSASIPVSSSISQTRSLPVQLAALSSTCWKCGSCWRPCDPRADGLTEVRK